jgi:YbbR domain-containing protein
MGKKILDSKVLYIFLSIFLAIGLWVYVRTVENPDKEKSISGIPVTFEGVDTLGANGLVIGEGSEQTVTIRVKGPIATLQKLTNETVTIKVNVSTIGTTGDYNKTYDIVWPYGVSGSDISVLDRSLAKIDFTVSKLASRTINVKGEFVGKPAKGYLVDEITISPSSIVITGDEAIVSQVDHAMVTVSGDNLSDSISTEMGFTLIGLDGKPLDNGLSSKISCNTDTVLVSMPIRKTKDIPLKVDFTAGGGATEDNISYTIEPSTITVSGDAAALDPLNELIIGTVNLASVTDSQTFTFPINMTQALTNVSNVTQATVTVTIKGLASSSFNVNSFSFINVPDGMAAAAVTQSLQVTVRGTEDAVKQVNSYNLRAVADLSSISAAEGQYTVPVTIYLDSSSGVGVVGTDYKMVVTLTKK